MFSAQPAKRPGHPGFRWFGQSNSPKRPDAYKQDCTSANPQQRSAQPAPQANPQAPLVFNPGSQPGPPVYGLAKPHLCNPLAVAHIPVPYPLRCPQPSPQPVPQTGPQPGVKAKSQSRGGQPGSQSGTGDPEAFDKWMAKFCVEPPMDADGCCLAFWAPYAQYGKTHWRLKQVEDGQDPSNASWQPNYGCNGPCWAWFGMCCLFQCDCLLTGFQRTRIRATYGIQGSLTKDFALSIFCRPCTMIQMDREVRAREGDIDLRTNPQAPCITNQPSRVQPMRYVSPRQTASDNSQNIAQAVRRDCSSGVCDGANPSAGLSSKKLQKQQPKSDKCGPEKPTSEKTKLELPKSEKLKPEKSNSEKPKPEEPRAEKPESDKPKWQEPTFEKQKWEKPTLESSNKFQRTQAFNLEMTQVKHSVLGPLKANDTYTSTSNSTFSPRDHSLPGVIKQTWEEKSTIKKAAPSLIEYHGGKRKESRSPPTPSSNHSSVHGPPEVPLKESDSKKGVDSSADTKGKAKEAPPRPHALSSSTSKVEESHTSKHAVVGSRTAKGVNERGKTSEHTTADDETIHSSSPKTKAAKKDSASGTHELSYIHDFTDCPIDRNILDYYEKEEKRSQASQQHALAECPETDNSTKTKSTSPQPHSLSYDEHTNTDSKVKSAVPQPHNLADCPEKDTSSPVKSVDQHALADCDHEGVSSPTPATEQHALADCYGDAGSQNRRASSPPDTPAGNHPQARQHRLASCPVHALDQKEDKAAIGQHIAENARINESGDSQSTVKPSSEHTLSDCMGGARLERQTNGETRDMRRSSLSSLRDFTKGNQDISDHPQKSRYRREVDNVAHPSGPKRTSHAHHALSQVLAGNGGKKENSHASPGDAVQDALQTVGVDVKKHTQTVGGAVQKRANDMRDAVKKTTYDLADGVKKQTNDFGETVKEHTHKMGDAVKTHADHVGDEIQKQTDNIRGKEESKSGSFVGIFKKSK